MMITLKPEWQKYVEEQVQSGRYASAEDVLTAALFRLQQNEKYGDFAPGELAALMAEGEEGEDIPGEQVFEEIRQMSEQFRKRKGRR